MGVVVLGGENNMTTVIYLDSSTVTTLESSTSSLKNIFYPSVTVCSRSQVRLVKYYINNLHSYIIRETFWMTIGLHNASGKKKRMIGNYFTGRAVAMTSEELSTINSIMRSPGVQKEYCDYMIHTGGYQ